MELNGKLNIILIPLNHKYIFYEVINMKIFEKRIEDNFVGCWHQYYFFGKKVYTKLIRLYVYK